MQLKNNNELRTKIDEKLQSLPKRKTNYGNASTKTSDQTKIMQKMKWNTIKRHLRQHHHLQRKDTGKGLQIVKPLEQKGELMDIIKRVMIVRSIQLIKHRIKLKKLIVFIVVAVFPCSVTTIDNQFKSKYHQLSSRSNGLHIFPMLPLHHLQFV